MVGPNETLNALVTGCPMCGIELHLEVIITCAPYLGFYCRRCGPVARETVYFESEEKAEKALEEWKLGRRPGRRG